MRAAEAVPPGFAVTVRVALSGPGAAGVSTTPIMQVAFMASVAPAQLLVMILKSVGVAMAVDRAPVVEPPVFLTVKVCAALVVMGRSGVKVAVAGVMVSAPGVAPAPARAAVTVPPGVAVTAS